jgi:hypothetical protein
MLVFNVAKLLHTFLRPCCCLHAHTHTQTLTKTQTQTLTHTLFASLSQKLHQKGYVCVSGIFAEE